MLQNISPPHIQGYINSYIVAVMPQCLCTWSLFSIHYNAFKNIYNSSNVRVNVIITEKMWIFKCKFLHVSCISYVYIFCRGKKTHREFIFIFYQTYILHTNFLLKVHSFWHIQVKFHCCGSLEYILIHTHTQWET